METKINYELLSTFVSEGLVRFKIRSLIKFYKENDDSVIFSIATIDYDGERKSSKISEVKIPKNADIIQVLIFAVLKNHYTYIEKVLPNTLYCQNETLTSYPKKYHDICKNCPHSSYCMAFKLTTIFFLSNYRKPIDFKSIAGICEK